MAENEIEVAAPPERVFALLSDASLYGDWVVGPQEVTEADVEWPATGSSLEHTSGIEPAALSDRTTVVESDPPHRLVMDARLGPVGTFRVDLRLESTTTGTRVHMTETAVDGPAKLVPGAIADVALVPRNAFSLRRLKKLAEQ